MANKSVRQLRLDALGTAINDAEAAINDLGMTKELKDAIGTLRSAYQKAYSAYSDDIIQLGTDRKTPPRPKIQLKTRPRN